MRTHQNSPHSLWNFPHYLCWCPHQNSRKLKLSYSSIIQSQGSTRKFKGGIDLIGVGSGHWETTGRCGLAGVGGLKTKLKLVALTSILAKAGSSVVDKEKWLSLLWTVFINFLQFGMSRVKPIFQIITLNLVFNKISLLSFPHVGLHPMHTAGSFKSPSHTYLYIAGRGR